VAISDDPKLLRDILDNSTLASLRFVHLPKIDQSGIEGKYDALFRDFRTILGAAGIIQHATNGWSAYSSLAGMIRQIPLINTWIGRPADPKRQSMQLGILAGLARVAGCPIELQSANRADEVALWLQRVRTAPDRPRVNDEVAAEEVTRGFAGSSRGGAGNDNSATRASVRFLLVVGPEGSSHSLMSMVFKNSSTYALLQAAEGGLDRHRELQRSLYNHWSSPGLFDWPCRPDHARDANEVFSRAVGSMQQMRNFVLRSVARRARTSSRPDKTQREIVIPVNSADDNAAGMGSYPNFPAGPGAGRWCQYPDVDAWFEACKVAAVNCSLLVLVRHPDEVIHSTTIRRGFQEKHAQIRTITDMLSIIHTQVQNNLEQPRWCWKYGDPDISGVASAYGLERQGVSTFFNDNFRLSGWSDKKKSELMQHLHQRTGRADPSAQSVREGSRALLNSPPSVTHYASHEAGCTCPPQRSKRSNLNRRSGTVGLGRRAARGGW